jgi:MFS family permease
VRKALRILAILLLASLFAANVYRARTQSFTADEALTYNNFVSGPWRAVWVEYDANNHVLNTLLARLSVAVFGVSEFTLRLPSLAGGALFLAACFLLCRRLFGDDPLLVISLAALTLNPFLLDFLSAARGYGLALGLFLWAIELLLRTFERGPSRAPTLAALALALSVAANLTFAFPGIVVAAVAAGWLARSRRWRALVDSFLLPGLLAAFLLLAIPLSYSEPSRFYVGSPSLKGTLDSMVDPSLSHSHPGPVSPDEPVSLLRNWLRIVTIPFAPIVLAASAACLAWLLWRRGPWTAERRLFALCASALLGSLALLMAAHHFAGLLYPERRTGLYLIPLFWFVVFALVRLVPGRAPQALAALAFSLYAIQFARQWNTKYYLEWLYDARTKEIVRLIDEKRDRSRPTATVSATWPVAATVDFYRRSRRLDWLQLQPRTGKPQPADFQILALDDRERAGNLEILLRDDFAGVVLARRRGALK